LNFVSQRTVYQNYNTRPCENRLFHISVHGFTKGNDLFKSGVDGDEAEVDLISPKGRMLSGKTKFLFEIDSVPNAFIA